MTARDFREIALSFPEAVESAHMSHPDFRVDGRIFATLGPDEDWGMVKLTPEQQVWAERLMAQGYRIVVCYSWTEAVEVILEYLGVGRAK